MARVKWENRKGKLTRFTCLIAPEVIRKKVMRAVTDSGPTAENQEKPTEIQNLFDLMKVVSTPDTYTHFDNLYNTVQIRYGDLKKQLAEDMIIATAPIRDKINDIAADADYLRQVARHGAIKARESASRLLKRYGKLLGSGIFNCYLSFIINLLSKK
jgi:tryptophanyl-tRNA synthetase